MTWCFGSVSTLLVPFESQSSAFPLIIMGMTPNITLLGCEIKLILNLSNFGRYWDCLSSLVALPMICPLFCSGFGLPACIHQRLHVSSPPCGSSSNIKMSSAPLSFSSSGHVVPHPRLLWRSPALPFRHTSCYWLESGFRSQL